MGTSSKKQINRREFLKKTGMAAGAVGASSLFPGVHVHAAEPLRLGMTADLTGVLADFGFFNARSARVAARLINEAGGVNGREIKLIIEDTESKPATGVRKTRKLIQRDKSDFVMGSHHSGICLASNPVFKELRTIGFPNGTATSITGAKGSPYVFRMNQSILHEVYSAAGWARKNLGKRWAFVGADMAWGQDQVRQWANRVKLFGGEVVTQIMIPVGADNMIPYLTRIDRKKVDVIFYALFAQGGVTFAKQAREMGFDEGFQFIVSYDSVEGVDATPFEGMWMHTPFPMRLVDVPEELRPYDAHLRKAIGVDEEGMEIKRGGRPTGHAHNVLGWEWVYLMRDAVKATGYKDKKKHTKDVIRFLQGHETKPSNAYPQGGKLIRAEDHQAFMDIYLQKVVNGKWVNLGRVGREEGIYPPQGNFKI